MHNNIFLASCISILTLVWLGVSLNSTTMMVAILSAVCLIGVPHGGLDHLSGRQWLSIRFGHFWFVPFFAGYVGIALVAIYGWLTFPLGTALGFFMISANHFGRDEQSGFSTCFWSSLAAVGSGGLVIWIPALTRPMEMQMVLQAIIPAEIRSSSESILFWTQGLAIMFVPIAGADIVYSVASPVARARVGFQRASRLLISTCIFATTPIPLSFAIFFCGWHSIRGLSRLMADHRMTLNELTVAAMPMSLGAICLCGLGMWLWNSERELSKELTRTLFLGLSGMAVPHLVLHDAIPMLNRRTKYRTNFLVRSAA